MLRTSSSGFSCCSVVAKICPARPARVMVKLIYWDRNQILSHGQKEKRRNSGDEGCGMRWYIGLRISSAHHQSEIFIVVNQLLARVCQGVSRSILELKTLSPICTQKRGPWAIKSFLMTGKRIGSMKSTSWTIRVLPNRTASSRAVVKLPSYAIKWSSKSSNISMH